MLRLADVIRRHGDDYLARYGDAVLPSHTRALFAIARCRTGALGGHLAQCNDCGAVHLLYHSCCHRACPQCGHDATHRWLDRQRQLLLLVPYFHVVFTLPSELRRLVRNHQRTVTFGYRDSQDQQRRSMTLPAHEFLRRFLQHVPPRGLHRVRAFGLLHSSQRTTLRRLQLLLDHRALAIGTTAHPRRGRQCPYCRSPAVRLLRRLSASECAAAACLVATANDATPRAPPGATTALQRAS